ncbi:MAG: deaminase [Bacilli bacterium]
MKGNTLMQIAVLVSQESHCCSWKVGAVIEKDGEIISTGCNGTPSGHDNCDDYCCTQGWADYHTNGSIRLKDEESRKLHSEWSRKNEVHAEINAIISAARKGRSIEGATMYVTVAPCSDCAKAIAQSGIRNLRYLQDYDKNDVSWSNIIRGHLNIQKLSMLPLQKINWNKITIQNKFLK